MKKELYTIKFENGKIEEVLSSEDNFYFKVDEKEYNISTYHESDCCENAWGDFSILKYHEKELVGKYFPRLVIKGIEGMGFLLCFEAYDSVKIFIPCYSTNNGYYSENLTLEIKCGESKTKIDIRELHEEK